MRAQADVSLLLCVLSVSCLGGSHLTYSKPEQTVLHASVDLDTAWKAADTICFHRSLLDVKCKQQVAQKSAAERELADLQARFVAL